MPTLMGQMKGQVPECYIPKLSTVNCLKSAKMWENMGRVYFKK